MKHKMMATSRLAFCLILILYGKSSIGKPLTPEDVQGLLPPDPHDKNETIAAVVQDPVVQDAVHYAANNGSLNGLVVKKHVFIMPATNPNLVLSKREHLLVVPTENLEDVRKNITEAKQSEDIESSSPENEAFFEEDASAYAPEEEESLSEDDKNESFREPNVDQSMPVNEKLRSETEFLKDTLSHGAVLPEDSSKKKVAVPIVAVIDPSNAEKGKVNSPIVAILPNQLNNGTLNSQVEFLKDNSNKIKEKAQNFIDKTSMTVNPDYWKSSTPSQIAIASSSAQGSVPIPFYSDQETPSLNGENQGNSLVTEGVFLTPVMVPQWNVYAASLQNDQGDYSRETGDMDVAEDIIFRPLFRYRQETQQRSKYYDESNRRNGYSSYYPRRAYFYRPRYDDY